jgi:hypothetical protein
MDIGLSLNYDTLGALRDRRKGGVLLRPSSNPANDSTPTRLPAPLPTSGSLQNGGTRLVSELREELPEGGFRRIRTFEQDDGRNFTKTEQFTLTERGARREVIQQNPSGSVTRYEEILDRESSGTFRRTQRFQDKSGAVSTAITPGFQVLDPFVLTGGGDALSATAPAPFDVLRGTRLDVRV